MELQTELLLPTCSLTESQWGKKKKKCWSTAVLSQKAFQNLLV